MSVCLTYILYQQFYIYNDIGNLDCISHCRWLQSQEFEKQKLGLAFVTAISLLHEEFMDSDKVTTASEALSHWLSSANTKQAPNPHAINPFRKDEETGVTEIDGMPNTNIFTVLNLGVYKHIHIFIF